jgi:protein-S-isoprenylcysteine O-methyltransferase Ste14
MTLLARTIAGFAVLFAVMGLAIFGAAGTVAFWRGWALIGVFAGCSGLITVWLWRRDQALLERRVRAGPGAEPEPVQNLIQALAGAAFLGALIAPGLAARFHRPATPAGSAVAGDALVALGFYVVFLTFRANSYASGVIERMEGQTLIDTGPYRRVRHPMYAGALLIFLGMPFSLGSWWDLPFSALIVAVLAWRLSAEERFLVQHLAGYDAYRRRVPWRLVPGVW